MSEKKEMKIAEVKGRPMLHWIGKHPLETVNSFPAQLVETFNTIDLPKVPTYDKLKDNWSNLLFHGDNKEVLSTLLVNGFRGKIDLIYIDPPFDSKADYVREVKLRGTKEKLVGEAQSLIEQVQYTDIWANDNYLQFMYERLILLHELLSDKGSIYLHCDWRKSHHLRFLLDEVFSVGNFIREIIWNKGNVSGWKSQANNWVQTHDTILFYKKGEKNNFNKIYTDYSEEYLANFNQTDENGKRYWQWSSTERRFLEDLKGLSVSDVWDDEAKNFNKEDIFKFDTWNIPYENNMSKNRTEYPTQKPEGLLKRIINASSDPDSIVIDCFIGSGTTAAVSQKLGRRWIGCDINKGAIQTTSKRLQNIIKEQEREIQKEKGKLNLEERKTYYSSLAHFKINDYDIQIQHNELKELVYEHLGIKRMPTDSFFDGMLGKELVRIIPFNHPLSLLDVQLVKNELHKRKDETRNIILVSLGMEVKVKNEIDSYNKLRPVNKIRTIELRTDKKYGSFFVHKPAQADVSITKQKDKAKVIIKDFISPTILQRLNIDSKLFQAQIKDFRSQIDVVLIDTNYNGEVFNICISDVPEKKKDFIIGEYEFELKNKNAKIAVKIIDMLGEEVLFIK
jgi:DNA modification methylase